MEVLSERSWMLVSDKYFEDGENCNNGFSFQRWKSFCNMRAHLHFLAPAKGHRIAFVNGTIKLPWRNNRFEYVNRSPDRPDHTESSEAQKNRQQQHRFRIVNCLKVLACKLYSRLPLLLVFSVHTHPDSVSQNYHRKYRCHNFMPALPRTDVPISLL